MNNTCDKCGGKIKEAYELEDDMVCEKCYQDAISVAEYAYESYREAEVTGN
jgi:reverse gyrase